MSKNEGNPIFAVAQKTVAALTEVEEEMRAILRDTMSPNYSRAGAAEAGATLVQAVMAKHSVHMSMFEMSAAAQAWEEEQGRKRLVVPTVG